MRRKRKSKMKKQTINLTNDDVAKAVSTLNWLKQVALAPAAAQRVAINIAVLSAHDKTFQDGRTAIFKKYADYDEEKGFTEDPKSHEVVFRSPEDRQAALKEVESFSRFADEFNLWTMSIDDLSDNPKALKFPAVVFENLNWMFTEPE